MFYAIRENNIVSEKGILSETRLQRYYSRKHRDDAIGNHTMAGNAGTWRETAITAKEARKLTVVGMPMPIRGRYWRIVGFSSILL